MCHYLNTLHEKKIKKAKKGLFLNLEYCYKNRALIPSTFQPKPNLVETTKACVPVVTPYFYS